MIGHTYDNVINLYKTTNLKYKNLSGLVSNLKSWKRSDELRQQFITDISVYDPNTFTVDESGSDKHSAL